jgi:hypothetical protein
MASSTTLLHNTTLLFYTGVQTVGLKSFIESNPEVISQLYPTRKDCNIYAQEVKDKIEFSDDETLERNAKTKDFFFQYVELLENTKEGTYNTYHIGGCTTGLKKGESLGLM